MTDELEALVVSGKELDRKSLAGILSPYVALDRDTANIRTREGWDRLRPNLKIIVYLLARKAMKALDLDLPTETAKPGEIAKDTGIKQGTVNPAVRYLLNDRIVAQADDGGYFVPNYAIEKVKGMLAE